MGVTIEDKCWIGSSVTIMKGVTIRKSSVIGVGMLVTKDNLAGSVVYDEYTKLIRKDN